VSEAHNQLNNIEVEKIIWLSSKMYFPPLITDSQAADASRNVTQSRNSACTKRKLVPVQFCSECEKSYLGRSAVSCLKLGKLTRANAASCGVRDRFVPEACVLR
jgi:hypothetical protein